jgi:hypothetical protein
MTKENYFSYIQDVLETKTEVLSYHFEKFKSESHKVDNSASYEESLETENVPLVTYIDEEKLISDKTIGSAIDFAVSTSFHIQHLELEEFTGDNELILSFMFNMVNPIALNFIRAFLAATAVNH